jgi:hypothetical protein
MMNIFNWFLPVFLIIVGLHFCGAALHRTVLVIGGVCGIIAAAVLVVGLG